MSSQSTATCTMEETMTQEPREPVLPVDDEVPEVDVDVQEAETALAALRPTLLDMSTEVSRSLKVSTTTAVSIGLAYARAYEEDRFLFERMFTPEAFDTRHYDNLADRARAFWQADIHMRQELNTEGPLRSLAAEAKPLRSKLLRAANYLWGDDTDLGDVVKNINKGVGYANHADDLGSLATLFTDRWLEADGHCDVTVEDIEEARRIGAEILRLISPSHREEQGEVKRLRHQAAEYLRQGIEDVRVAASYVFRNNHKKLERYPSLFVRKRRKTDKPRVSGEVNPSVPSTAPDAPARTSEPSVESPSPVGDNIGAIPELG